MGWTWTSKPTNVRQWYKDQLTWEYRDKETGKLIRKYTCLDVALKKYSQLYAAVECVTYDGDGNISDSEVFCSVSLVRFSRGDSYYNFGCKDMDEFAGPGITECPERILKLLSPLTSENDPNGWAREWREACWKRIKSSKPIKWGDVIRTERPVRFTSGAEEQYFTRAYPHRRTRWDTAYPDGEGKFIRSSGVYKFDPRQYGYEVVGQVKNLTKTPGIRT